MGPRTAFLAAALVALAPVAAPAATGLEQIQKEFKTAIEKGTPATVVVTARDSRFGCSGVMVSREATLEPSSGFMSACSSPKLDPNINEFEP